MRIVYWYCTIPNTSLTWWVYTVRLDTYKYIVNPDGNISCIFLVEGTSRWDRESKGAGAAQVQRKKGALHTLLTFGKLNT